MKGTMVDDGGRMITCDPEIVRGMSLLSYAAGSPGVMSGVDRSTGRDQYSLPATVLMYSNRMRLFVLEI